MADERSTPLNQGTNKWLQITDGGKLQTWDGVDSPTPIIGNDPLVTKTELDDKASLSSANTFQEKQTLNKDAEIHSLTVGRGGGGISSNTALGESSLENNTTGIRNTAVGLFSLRDNTEGNDNTAVGRRSLQSNTEGANNTAVGEGTLRNNTEGGANTAVGRFSLLNNTTADGNTAHGFLSLFDNTTGINNIGIGESAGRSSSPFEVTTQDNRIVMGNNNHTDAYIRIGWTVTSDKRDKTNFAEVPYGLDFVKELKPTKYQFREERGSEYTDGKDRYGFLAQDILELEGDEPVIIDNEDSENLKFKESHLIPVLVNAIQELTKEVETLKEKIND